ncbi:MAG: IPT/TIG domain-containing protein [Planctomycetes bacterium]|nr:IPT/TIG domain-containing protein [Planctomycetota bacterium]
MLGRGHETIALSRRFVFLSPILVGLVYLAVFSGTTYAFMRLASGAAGIFWAGTTTSAVPYTISSIGSDDVGDQSEATAFRLAFKAWERLPDCHLRFLEVTDAGQRARTDWQAGDLHLCWFDEGNASSFFSGGSGIIAVTPISFFANGQIADADIIFNGRDHRFSTDGTPGTFDIQNIATHEVGHFLGLDHTAVFGATMYPFAFQGMVSQRSLQADDVAGARHIYPETSDVSGRITGRVVRPGGQAVNGAHLVAVDLDGEPASAGRSDAAGNFLIGGLAPGSYSVYAEPLDGPVEEANLQASGLDRAFGTTFLLDEFGQRQSVQVQARSDSPLARELAVNPQTALNLLSVSPAIVTIGTSMSLTVSGQGLGSGSTASFSGTDVAIVRQSFSALTGRLAVDVQVRANSLPGLRNVEVRGPSGDVAVLTGGLELARARPQVVTVSPNRGEVAGGTSVTVSGANFFEGTEVTIGGEMGASVQVVGSTTLRLTTPPGRLGLADLTVIGADGQFTILRGGFEYSADPVVGALTPARGPTGGGTLVSVEGANFQNGAQVLIDDKLCSAVSFVSSAKLSAVTPAGTLGKKGVKVRNPNGAVAQKSEGFEYIAPRITARSPDRGSSNGGTRVLITGEGFGAGAQVSFGGVPGTGVSTSADGTSITVVAPVASATVGSTDPDTGGRVVDVVVRNSDGTQGTATGGFTYIEGLDPVVSSVAPSSGPTSGATPLVIAGDNFLAGASVSIGGRAATQVVVASPLRIECLSPAGDVGPRDVAVRNPDTLEGILRGGYDYRQPAASTGVVSGSGKKGGGGGCQAVTGPATALDASGVLGHVLPFGLFLLAALRRKLAPRRPSPVP